MNGILSGVVVPIIHFADCIPLRLCAVECDARQSGALGERQIADARDTIRNRDARQSGAPGERTVINTRDAVRDRDARKSRATRERRIADARSSGNHNSFQIFRNIIFIGRIRRRAENVPEVCIACSAFCRTDKRNRSARKSRAPGENLPADARDAVRNRDIHKTGAQGERITADARDAVRNRDIHKTGAPGECIITDARNTVRNGKFGN